MFINPESFPEPLVEPPFSEMINFNRIEFFGDCEYRSAFHMDDVIITTDITLGAYDMPSLSIPGIAATLGLFLFFFLKKRR